MDSDGMSVVKCTLQDLFAAADLSADDKKVAGMFSFRRISSIFGVVESVGPSSNVRQIVFISVSLGCGSFMQEDAAGRGGENKRAVASTSALMNLIMQSVCPKKLDFIPEKGCGEKN